LVLGNAFANNQRAVSWEGAPEHEAEVLKQNFAAESAPPRAQPPRRGRR
jgi:hypothetical protein